MKTFRRYNPYQIAKYVKTLFKGQFYLPNVGAFRFEYGKVCRPSQGSRDHFIVMSEVNRQVLRLAMI